MRRAKGLVAIAINGMSPSSANHGKMKQSSLFAFLSKSPQRVPLREIAGQDSLAQADDRKGAKSSEICRDANAAEQAAPLLKTCGQDEAEGPPVLFIPSSRRKRQKLEPADITSDSCRVDEKGTTREDETAELPCSARTDDEQLFSAPPGQVPLGTEGGFARPNLGTPAKPQEGDTNSGGATGQRVDTGELAGLELTIDELSTEPGQQVPNRNLEELEGEKEKLNIACPLASPHPPDSTIAAEAGDGTAKVGEESKGLVDAAIEMKPAKAPALANDRASHGHLTPYELERLEQIRQNEVFLARLEIKLPAGLKPRGKEQSAAARKGKSKLTADRRAASASAPAVRRSTRNRLQETPGPPLHAGQERTPPQPASFEPEPAPLFYDDSSVVKYVCGSTRGWAGASDLPSDRSSDIVGFEPGPVVLADDFLARVYTIDCLSQVGGAGLLAAGGQGGRIAVFGLDQEEQCGSGGEEEDEEGSHHRESLLSWAGSRSWISAVQFVSKQSMEGSTLLLSSSNDRSVVLWDINKVAAEKGNRAEPKVVAKMAALHSNGIFGMHELQGRIATASKDKTVAISRLTHTGIEHEQSIDGLHAAAVRGVHFRDVDTLADCSADGSIHVHDLRAAGEASCVVTFEDAHESAVNTVEWHPLDEHLLLSASHDPQLRLFDLRKPEGGVMEYGGHLGPALRRSKNILRPAFVAEGQAIATAGEGSGAISLYNTTSGKPISRGQVGYDATMVVCSTHVEGAAAPLWVASPKGIVRLEPKWQR